MRPGPIAVLFLQKAWHICYHAGLGQGYACKACTRPACFVPVCMTMMKQLTALIEADMASSQGVEHDTKVCALVVVLM